MRVDRYEVTEALEGRVLRNFHGRVFHSRDVEAFVLAADPAGLKAAATSLTRERDIAMRVADRLLRKWQKVGQVEQGAKRGDWTVRP